MRLEERADVLDVLLASRCISPGRVSGHGRHAVGELGVVCKALKEAAIEQVVAEPYAARGIEVRPLAGFGGAVMLNGAPMPGTRAGVTQIASRDAVGGPGQHGGH